MNLISQHIRKHLHHFHDENDAFFQSIFELLQSEVKYSHRPLLRYIHFILNEAFSDERRGTDTLHLHFEFDFNIDSQTVIAEYLLIRYFKERIKSPVTISYEGENVKQIKSKLNSRLTKLSVCPAGASGRNGGNKIYKSWIKDKNDAQALIDFYNQFEENQVVFPDTLFNCQVSVSTVLNNHFYTKPYASEVENWGHYPTYNLVNTKLTLNQIDEVDSSIIDNLKTVILFDCDRKKIMQCFSLDELSSEDYRLELNRYLIVSFGNKDISSQKFRDRINLIQNRFRINRNSCYPIIQSEMDYFFNIQSKRNIQVSFIGIDKSHFWDEFILETTIQELYELRSIKMMNMYSLCFNVEIRDYILNEIFSNKTSSEIVSSDTLQRLLDISNEDLVILKNSLSNTLDLIINSAINQHIKCKIKEKTVLLVDDVILNSKNMCRIISSSILLSSKNRLISWYDLKSVEKSDVLVLSYQDQGKYPYFFYPNVLEGISSQSITIEAIFHKFLFSTRYLWATYNMLKEIFKLTNHPIRNKHFQWERLKVLIEKLRPTKDDDTNWEFEQHYSRYLERETVKVKLKNERERTFNSSELFIYSSDNCTFKVDKIGTIIESIDSDTKCFVQNLDDIQESINLYENIVDTKQHEEELNVIRRQFSVDNESTGRLWKVLLYKKSQALGADVVFDDIKKYLSGKGLKLVSFNYFENNWLNPDSDSIAPLNKKVFIELCTYLELPRMYYILIQRLRNVSKQNTRQSTLQMNRLLQDLYNDCCFDAGANVSNIIDGNLQKYKMRYPIDELGIDENYLSENLILLIELIKPEINLKEVEA